MSSKVFQSKKLRKDNSGFTIIELLIATVVMSLVLILLTTGVIQMTDSYYQGVTQTNTQNAARSIINTIGQALQFQGLPYNAGNTTPSISGDCYNAAELPYAGCRMYFCIGDQEYVYQLGDEVVGGNPQSNQAYHGFVILNGVSDATQCTAPGTDNYLQQNQSLGNNATEFLSPSMRLSEFKIAPIICAPPVSDPANPTPQCSQNVNQLYEIDVQVTYGNDNLLMCPGDNSDPAQNQCAGTGTTCNSEVSTSFCDTADLHSIVDRRVNTQ